MDWELFAQVIKEFRDFINTIIGAIVSGFIAKYWRRRNKNSSALVSNERRMHFVVGGLLIQPVIWNVFVLLLYYG